MMKGLSITEGNRREGGGRTNTEAVAANWAEARKEIPLIGLNLERHA